MSPATTPDDISGTVDAASNNNLVGTGGSGGLTNGVNSNQVGVVDARLGPLAGNGGQLRHTRCSRAVWRLMREMIQSPARHTATTDQRGTGFARQADGPDANTTQTVDIGSV